MKKKEGCLSFFGLDHTICHSSLLVGQWDQTCFRCSFFWTVRINKLKRQRAFTDKSLIPIPSKFPCNGHVLADTTNHEKADVASTQNPVPSTCFFI